LGPEGVLVGAEGWLMTTATRYRIKMPRAFVSLQERTPTAAPIKYQGKARKISVLL